jgi:hypothetical protein
MNVEVFEVLTKPKLHWLSQNCIDFISRMALQKWGNRFMQQKDLKKLAHLECSIFNSLRQISPQKG